MGGCGTSGARSRLGSLLAVHLPWEDVRVFRGSGMMLAHPACAPQ